MATEPTHPGHDADDAMEVEAPRRAASAQFVVDAEVGDTAALREAMDPANQSLADALRLSYRVLQAVIVVLVVMFLISGVKIVEQDQSGVMLRFGKVVRSRGDNGALEPGRTWSLLPYPAADFVTFDVVGRRVDMSRVFWPQLPPGTTEEQAIERARATSGLRLGRLGPGKDGDGALLTRDTDLAHMKLAASYRIDDPVGFVQAIRLDDAEKMIRAAVERAVVRTAARLELTELVQIADATRDEIQAEAQRVLDAIGSGITLDEITVTDATPPFAVVKVYDDLQNAREEAQEMIASARQEATNSLIGLAGENYQRLAELIEVFEIAYEHGDAGAELAAINDFLDGNGVGGELEEQIERAKAFESQIELSLGAEVKRFHSLLPAYRRNPLVVIKREWINTLKKVLDRRDGEIFYVPADSGPIRIAITSSEDIAKRRSEARMQRRRDEAFSDFKWDPTRRAGDFELDRSEPLLKVGEGGRVGPRFNRD